MEKSRIKWIYGIFIGKPVRAVFFYRLSSWLYHHKLNFLAQSFRYINVCLHSCDIDPKAEIGEGFVIHHSVGIVIGGGVIVGKGLQIYQNVSLVKDNKSNYPKVGNFVTLYTGSVIIGNVVLGDNCIIGANAVVLKTVPENSTAVGVPARIIPSL